MQKEKSYKDDIQKRGNKVFYGTIIKPKDEILTYLSCIV